MASVGMACMVMAYTVTPYVVMADVGVPYNAGTSATLIFPATARPQLLAVHKHPQFKYRHKSKVVTKL